MGYGIIVYTHNCSGLCFCRYKSGFFLRAVMQKTLVHTGVVIPGHWCAWEMDVSRQVKQRRKKAKEKESKGGKASVGSLLQIQGPSGFAEEDTHRWYKRGEVRFTSSHIGSQLAWEKTWQKTWMQRSFFELLILGERTAWASLCNLSASPEIPPQCLWRNTACMTTALSAPWDGVHVIRQQTGSQKHSSDVAYIFPCLSLFKNWPTFPNVN